MIDPVKKIVELAIAGGVAALPDVWRKDAAAEGVIVSEVSRAHLTGNGFDPLPNKASLTIDCRAKGRNRAIELENQMKKIINASGLAISFLGGISIWDNDVDLFRYSFTAVVRI